MSDIEHKLNVQARCFGGGGINITKNPGLQAKRIQASGNEKLNAGFGLQCLGESL